MNVTGMIDLQTCAKVIAEYYQQYMLPMGIVAGAFAIFFLIMIFIYLSEHKERQLLDAFLHREKLLNKYADWKKDRELN